MVIWLLSLVCIEPLTNDCGFMDRVLAPLTAAASKQECLDEGRKFAEKMKVQGKWVIVCTEGTSIEETK